MTEDHELDLEGDVIFIVSKHTKMQSNTVRTYLR